MRFFSSLHQSILNHLRYSLHLPALFCLRVIIVYSIRSFVPRLLYVTSSHCILDVYQYPLMFVRTITISFCVVIPNVICIFSIFIFQFLFSSIQIRFFDVHLFDCVMNNSMLTSVLHKYVMKTIVETCEINIDHHKKYVGMFVFSLVLCISCCSNERTNKYRINRMRKKTIKFHTQKETHKTFLKKKLISKV